MINLRRFLNQKFNSNSLNIFKKFSTSISNTIFALSSGNGKCGIAVIRISGPHTMKALQLMTNIIDPPKPRLALLKDIRNPNTSEILDKGIILWFPGPKSFTGEDCCELHVHGSLAVINAILNTLLSIPNLRLAEPGEFTRRAFYNGKLDLTEVEGLGDLLQAETELQRKQAFLQLQGSLSNLYNKWRDNLKKSLAHLEAHIDFDETEDLNDNLLKDIYKNIYTLYNEINVHLKSGYKGEILRNGVKTVIIGEPNVGKSSLLNLLCKRPAAIVTELAGTTRDILEVTLNIKGYPLVLIDTAGLRQNTDDIVEKEGINRALNYYQLADLIILVVDIELFKIWREKLNDNCDLINYIKYYVKKLGLNQLINDNSNNFNDLFQRECLIVLNKIDLINEHFNGINSISCKTGQGFEELLKNLEDRLKILCGEPSKEHPSMNQIRHRQHLIHCQDNLNLFLKNSQKIDCVLLAEYLRKSIGSLGKLVGIITTDELLDVIFRDFCIGK